MIDLERLTMQSFAGEPVAVLGFARSGLALARFLHDCGARVTVYDARPPSGLGKQVAQLDGRDVRLLLGPEIDPADALAGQALIATSPSINSRYPTTEPRLRAALGAVEAARQVPVVSEVDLFLRLCPATTVGITGTKGKTTTSALTAAVLGAGPARTFLGGNIGMPLVERLPELTAGDRVVIELSELQLPTLSRGTDVAVYTHVTSDHLDRHGSVEAYRAAKRRLAELAPPEGRLVLNAEDPVSSAFVEASRAASVFYRRGEPPPGGVGVRDDWIVADGVELMPGEGGGRAAAGPGGRIMPLGEVLLPGAHNTSNVLAAVTVGVLHGVAPDAIRRAVGGFRGVEHRLEPVATIDGVRFVNDSQGTQPDAVVAALRSFPPPIVLICGGRSKDLELDELARVVAQRATAAVVIGETGPQMSELFARAGLELIEQATDMVDAVRRADRRAREARQADQTATVLLSPAAASFDMFTDYAERGDAFKAAVHLLAREKA